MAGKEGRKVHARHRSGRSGLTVTQTSYHLFIANTGCWEHAYTCAWQRNGKLEPIKPSATATIAEVVPTYQCDGSARRQSELPTCPVIAGQALFSGFPTQWRECPAWGKIR
jgi:hypothetical protein